ncbi:hypothetical protein [Hyphomicrobium sulfonivorans]|uniref:hypothetical protein n=1 Tax=Hyphomicrobium sulfonivorans TaxID=121290 RepID=UPI000838F84F|nr:hypothetical protein [Hyphomicrobium sulfonivorans]
MAKLRRRARKSIEDTKVVLEVNTPSVDGRMFKGDMAHVVNFDRRSKVRAGDVLVTVGIRDGRPAFSLALARAERGETVLTPYLLDSTYQPGDLPIGRVIGTTNLWPPGGVHQEVTPCKS